MKGLIVVYGLAYGGALVALFNPFVGLLVYVAFAVLRPEFLWPWSIEPGSNVSKVIMLALVGGWLFKGLGSWRFGRGWPIVLCLLGYLSWASLSGAMAPDKEVAWQFIDSVIKIVLPFVIGLTLIDSMRKLKQLAWVILVCEGYLAYEFNMWYFGGYNRLWIEGFGGMDNNSNAIALVTCTGLALFLGMDAEKWWQKAIALVCAGLIVHAILISFSRGGMLALIVTGLMSFVLLPKRPKHYLMFLAAVALTVSVAGNEVVARFRTVFASQEERDESAGSRLQLWGACLQLMSENPLGVGPSHFGLNVERFGYNRGKLAHTLWLQTGAELGLPGLMFLAGFYGLCVLRLWRFTRPKVPVPDPEFRTFARMVIAAIVGFAVSAQFVSLDRLEIPYYVVLIGAGLLKVAAMPQPTPAVRNLPAVPIRPMIPVGRMPVPTPQRAQRDRLSIEKR